MNPNDHRSRHEDIERPAQPAAAGYPSNAHAGSGHEAPDSARPDFTLLVAGCRGGKTSFLRLLLDTSDISPSVSKDQLASVAKFVQGCSGHTTYIRTANVTIELDADANGGRRPLGLTLIDTPSFDFRDEQAAERLMAETIHHIDSRFVEGMEDEWKAHTGDRYVHLCIYFLDPDQIIPPSVLGPPAPLVTRARNNSFSQGDQEPVILEPPVTTQFRAALPKADIAAIRRLSGRVNVLPVIARADLLSNDRLVAIKVAIRQDLAEAGIGFGIFDVEHHLPDERAQSSNGYANHPNGSSASNSNSPPTSPVAATVQRLPYALISPDMYSHSEGVSRKAHSRYELTQQYTPSPQYPPLSKLCRGKFIRSYRWGVVDVLEPAHSDFLSLRSAIFHHMDTLQKYTKQYLFDKFRAELQQHQWPSRHPSTQHSHPVGPMPSNSRPILAIDTAHQAPQRHSTLAVPVHVGDLRASTNARPILENNAASGSVKSSGQRANKQRTKKITVACNFCRSRKLKCDGGRPACGQCMKRSNPCDYMPQNKRRGTISRTQRPKGEESESESGDERSPEPSVSPEVSSHSAFRRSSNVDKLHPDGYQPANTLPPMKDRRDSYSSAMGPSGGPPPLPPPPPPPAVVHHPSAHPKIIRGNDQQQHNFYPDNELPHIATLLPDPSPSTPAPMSAPNLSLAPIRPASEQQAALRKRAATVPGKNARASGSSGPKVVACNFCRARKTKCDGAHPACASCARRQLACNYVHDNTGPGPKKRRASTSKPNAESPESMSPPSSRMIPTPSTGNDIPRDARDFGGHLDDEIDLKRPLEHSDARRAAKKMRMEESLPIAQ